jgi:YD repeat-containing protein
MFFPFRGGISVSADFSAVFFAVSLPEINGMVTMEMRRIVVAAAVMLSGLAQGGRAQDRTGDGAEGSSVREEASHAAPDSTRERYRNLVAKELNTFANGKRQWLDHLTVWNGDGLKAEEIEYAAYGQRERVTYEYDENGKCIRENVYNDRNKLYRIRKYEYFPDGRKKVQYNYNPDGKLYSTKRYEYTYK